MRRGARSDAAKRRYDTPRKQCSVLVSLELDVTDPQSEAQQRIVGVDLGQRSLAVAT